MPPKYVVVGMPEDDEDENDGENGDGENDGDHDEDHGKTDPYIAEYIKRKGVSKQLIHQKLYYEDARDPTNTTQLKRRKLTKKEREKIKNQRKRIQLIGDTSNIIAKFILEEWKSHIIHPWLGPPIKSSSTEVPMFLERHPKRGTTIDSMESYSKYLKSLYDSTHTWVKLASVNRMFRKAVKDEYYAFLAMIAKQNRAISTHGWDLSCVIRHPMSFIKTHLIRTMHFKNKTGCHDEDSDFLWFPKVCLLSESGFSKDGAIMKSTMDKLEAKFDKPRTIISYLNLAFDIKCRVCNEYAKGRLLWGTMGGWRMCRTCKRNKLIEISTASVRFGIKSMVDMDAFKNGTIKMCPTNTAKIDNILYIDPSATMLKPTRPMFWVDVDSLRDAFGGSEQLIAQARMTFNLRLAVTMLMNSARSGDIGWEYREKFIGMKHKAASCRSVDKFAETSMKIHNAWFKRGPNQYFLANSGEGYVPGLKGLPDKMPTLRKYMKPPVLDEIYAIEAKIRKRKARAIRRSDGGEVGGDVDDDTDDEPIPTFVPAAVARKFHN